MPIPVGVPIALGAAGLISSLIGGANRPDMPNIPTYDPSADIERIKAVYGEAGAGVQASVEAGMQGMTAQTSANLARRGVFSSPVSEYAYSQDRQAKINALTQAQQNIALQRSQAISSIIGQGADYNQRVAIANAQNQYQNDLANMQSWQTLGGGLLGAAGALAK